MPTRQKTEFGFSSGVVVGLLHSFSFTPDELHLREDEFDLPLVLAGEPMDFGSAGPFTMGETRPNGPLIIWALMPVRMKKTKLVSRTFCIRLSRSAPSSGLWTLGRYTLGDRCWNVAIDRKRQQ
jgi:hypothetical protein